MKQLNSGTILLIKTEKCLREAQAHEKKLGIEKGEMLGPRRSRTHLGKYMLGRKR